MPIRKYAILVLLQFISHNFYAQNSSKIILDNTFDYQSEILSEKKINWNALILAEVASEEPKSLIQPINADPKIEEDYLGLNWSIGLGIGYSSHAAAYTFDDGLRIKEFSGFRAVALDTKVGWRFHKRVAIFGTWKYSPGNATISPFRSNYLGGGLVYYFGDSEQFAINGGLGEYQTKVGRNEGFGNGLLMNYGMMIKFTKKLGFELNVLSGKIKFDDTNPTISDSMELNFTAILAILF